MFEEALGEANEAHYRVMATLDHIQPENWIEHDVLFLLQRSLQNKDERDLLHETQEDIVLMSSCSIRL